MIPQPESFDQLRTSGLEAVELGNLDRARILFSRALELATASEDQVQQDNARCNLAAIAIVRGCGDSEISSLREILVRNRSANNSFLAAYNISHHYSINKEYKKSQFYARVALGRAEQLERLDWMAWCHNRIGNVVLADSWIDAAVEEYETALQLMPSEAAGWRARILNNLGYCRIIQHRLDEGFLLLYQSLRTLRRMRAERYLISVHLDLCYAHLDAKRYRDARRHGLAALRISDRFADEDGQRNALYLLGETASLGGSEEEALFYFSRLQQGFFPDADYLPSFLLSVDVRSLINLHA